ncbi:hypothetical protein OROGR_025456 [Orobanche gracilis]
MMRINGFFRRQFLSSSRIRYESDKSLFLPNSHFLSLYVFQYVQNQASAPAIYLFKDICNLGVSVNEYTMTIAINCYCLSNRVDFGFSILGWFVKRGFIPNAFTFSTLLKGLFRGNRINEAQKLFMKMVKEGLCEPDVVTYGIVIDGLCKAGNIAMAIEILRVMEKGVESRIPIYII